MQQSQSSKYLNNYEINNSIANKNNIQREISINQIKKLEKYK